ncbi:MAG: hypothetical protein WCA80_05865 [Candidatus Aquilonibacter sp.]|jgi:hypothetical protein
MPPQVIFLTQLVLGYVACLLLIGTYVLPKLTSMDRIDALRAIATFHSFRIFGLIFILPGVVGASLPAAFATGAAYGDFATGVLALLALLTLRIRALFWFFMVAFNLVGAADILLDYYHGIQSGLPNVAGQLGVGYAIVILYVPALMITHVIAFYVLTRPSTRAAWATAESPL